MGHNEKQVEGQLMFDFCLDKRNYVCQANSLVGGKQALKLNSAKIIRSAIMQIVRDDVELKPYIITIPEIAELLNISASNIYRDINSITDDIMNNPVFIKRVSGKNVSWVKIPWCSRCEYNSDIGLMIKLNEELKPFLINLQGNYTQYALESILTMKSVYSVRIFELLQSKIMTKLLPKEGVFIDISLEELKAACDCDSDAYNKFANFKMRVLEVAKKDINGKTNYVMDYEYIKKNRKVVAIRFFLNMNYH